MMNNVGYLALANFIIWGVFFLYVVKLQRKNDALRREIDILKLERKEKDGIK